MASQARAFLFPAELPEAEVLAKVLLEEQAALVLAMRPHQGEGGQTRNASNHFRAVVSGRRPQAHREVFALGQRRAHLHCSQLVEPLLQEALLDSAAAAVGHHLLVDLRPLRPRQVVCKSGISVVVRASF